MIAVSRSRDPDEVYEELAAINPNAMVADGFEEAYLGYTVGLGMSVAVYDYKECVNVLVRRDGMTEEEAIEYLDHNTVYAYVGECTPLFIGSTNDR